MGEMKKLEEVARAIFDAMDVADGLDGTVARKYAVAAIEAMRVPTEAMCEVARNEAPNSEYDTFDDELMTKWYQSMIDEALKE